MNTQQLHDALTGLDEKWIASTARAREKKNVNWGQWAVLAACACLVLVLGAKVLPFFAANSAAPENASKSDGQYSLVEDEGALKSESSHWEGCELLVLVSEVYEGRLVVKALEGQDIAEDSLISVPVSGEETFAVGDKLRIFHNGQLLETWPLQLGEIYGIERIG